MTSQVVKSICGFCHSNCGVKIHLRDGQIAKIEGDPDHPANRGFLCVKAQGIKPLVESQDRLKFPLKKTKGGFIRISWDEALDLAADRLTGIREKYGAESLFRFCGAPVSYEGRDGFLQFMGAYGSPNCTGVSNLCHAPRVLAFSLAFGGKAEPDYDRAKLMLFWGANPVNTNRFSSYASYEGFHNIIPRAKERGAKIYAVDPMRSETVSLADGWIRPNMGTDSALGLAMIHTLIREGLYDEEFVNRWVPGFEEIKKHVEALSPEWAEKITSVSADRIREFARLYATTEGSLILDGNGLDMQTNGVDTVRVICLLIALTGNVDRPGGNVFFSIVPQKSLPTIHTEKKWLGWEEFPLFGSSPFPAIKRALLNEAMDRPRGMIVHHSNPVLVQANQEATQRALGNLDFLMVLDIFPTATTEIADLVLPVASDFERVDYRAYTSSRGGYLALREKVAEPAGESRSVFEVEYALAKKMGLAGSYPFQNTEEWINFVLEPSRVTIDDLRNNFIIYASPPLEYRKYVKEGFQTPSGKVECYSERFKSGNYGALPDFHYPKGMALSADHDLMGTSRKPAEYVHTKLRNLPAIRKLYPNPRVMIHPTDADRRGISEGDPVEVKSPRGKIQVEAHISEDILPGVIAVDFGWGNPTDQKASLNVLTSDETWDPISGGYPIRMFVCGVESLSREKSPLTDRGGFGKSLS